MSLAPGPEQTPLMMAFRRDWATQSAVVSKTPRNKSRMFFINVSLLRLLPRRPRHQIDEDFVELLRINIELNRRQPFIRRHWSRRIPEQRLPIARAVVYVDVHIQLPLPREDRGINQRRARDLVPHVAGKGILVEIRRDRCAR